MISTKNDRIKRAQELLFVLVGSLTKAITYGNTRRPLTLPAGINYTPIEWNIIRQVAISCEQYNDVSIQFLFELEEMTKKYEDKLFLAKLGK